MKKLPLMNRLAIYLPLVCIVLILIYGSILFFGRRIQYVIYKPVKTTQPVFNEHGWNFYKYKDDSFYFSYPQRLTVNERSENDGYSRIELVSNTNIPYIADGSICLRYPDGYYSIYVFNRPDVKQAFDKFFFSHLPVDVKKPFYTFSLDGHAAYRQSSVVYIDAYKSKYIEIFSCTDNEEFNQLLASFHINDKPEIGPIPEGTIHPF